jgi:hypothetical protein
MLGTDVLAAVLIIVAEFPKLAGAWASKMELMTFIDGRPASSSRCSSTGFGATAPWRLGGGLTAGGAGTSAWSVGVGMRHLGWVDQEQLRPVKTR